MTTPSSPLQALADQQPENPAGVGPLAKRSDKSAQLALKTIHQVHARHCPDPECLTCGVLSCPFGEPMHFHHDGCPACADLVDDVDQPYPGPNQVTDVATEGFTS